MLPRTRSAQEILHQFALKMEPLWAKVSAELGLSGPRKGTLDIILKPVKQMSLVIKYEYNQYQKCTASHPERRLVLDEKDDHTGQEDLSAGSSQGRVNVARLQVFDKSDEDPSLGIAGVKG